MRNTLKMSLLYALLLFLLLTCKVPTCWAGGWVLPKEGTIGHAAFSGKLPDLKMMLAQDPALLDTEDHQGMTLLMYASAGDQVEMVQFLLDSGAKANHVGVKEGGPIHKAGPKVIPLLVKADADVNSLAGTSTPLGNVLNKPNRAEALLKSGANPNMSRDGDTPLFWLVYRYPMDRSYRTDDYRKVLALLMRYGADPDIVNAGEHGPKESPRALAQKATAHPELLTALNQPRVVPATPALVIKEGEIALTGSIVSISKEKGQFVISAEGFTLPTGKSGVINPKKQKSIMLTPQTLIHKVGDSKALTLVDLIVGGKLLQVVGIDAGTGKSSGAREIVVR